MYPVTADQLRRYITPTIADRSTTPQNSPWKECCYLRHSEQRSSTEAPDLRIDATVSSSPEVCEHSSFSQRAMVPPTKLVISEDMGFSVSREDRSCAPLFLPHQQKLMRLLHLTHVKATPLSCGPISLPCLDIPRIFCLSRPNLRTESLPQPHGLDFTNAVSQSFKIIDPVSRRARIVVRS